MTRDPISRSHVSYDCYWIFAVCGIFIVALILKPSGDSQTEVSIVGTSLSLPDLCQFKRFFGRDCPGCGMTRSFIFAARLQLADAWAIQPIGTLLAIFLAATIPQRLWKIHQRLRGRRFVSTTKLEIGIAILLTIAAYVRWCWNACIYHSVQ